ncbi:uncharacterized protein [Coffea arabica]|uniref:Uncharacterized protein n=1 Tax=Coffea arabica TaxID=13443 RepID=A0A6P6STP5_COFAR|nr:uncharacterized protein LOC113694642 [Coffea arabica]
MADNYAISCLVGLMDNLWFHNVILVSEPSTPSLYSKIHKPSSMAAVSEELLYSSSNDSQTQLISDEDSSSSSITNQAEFDEQESDEKETTTTCAESEVTASRSRSQSSSPSNLKRSRSLRLSSTAGTTGRRLHKTMSCKSLCELELEEVQGFMDLGFIFNNENMSKRMMSVIPGLQRLELSGSTIQGKDNILMGSPPHNETRRVEGGAEQTITRPYLSEAWLIRRPDSPLLNLRIPRVSTAADMKKHLKYWARTVASAIALET